MNLTAWIHIGFSQQLCVSAQACVFVWEIRGYDVSIHLCVCAHAYVIRERRHHQYDIQFISTRQEMDGIWRCSAIWTLSIYHGRMHPCFMLQSYLCLKLTLLYHYMLVLAYYGIVQVIFNICVIFSSFDVVVFLLG